METNQSNEYCNIEENSYKWNINLLICLDLVINATQLKCSGNKRDGFVKL